jgi:hypothetical protein
MRMLATLHRWWGVAFCLLFAMWFASGIVMHFVAFPARSAGGTSIGGVHSVEAAHDIAAAYARSHELDASQASAEAIDHDQWTVGGNFDSDRPLYRLAINDDAGTEIYVSSASGEIVLLTTRSMRIANYFGSIAHWIYPTLLRHHHKMWSALLWWLSLAATVGATIGVIIGVVRTRTGSVYRGLQRGHHIFGLIFAPFILCWICSGFLSMNDGWPMFDSLFRKLHTFEFAPLTSHPWVRSSLIVGLCLCGLVFSLTGVVLAWRRLRMGAPSRKMSVA